MTNRPNPLLLDNVDWTASTVAAMATLPLTSGARVRTLGYWVNFDGGGATYRVMTEAEFATEFGAEAVVDEIGDRLLDNGLIAVLDHGGLIACEQFGATSGGERSAAIQAANDYLVAWHNKNRAANPATLLTLSSKIDMAHPVTFGQAGIISFGVDMGRAVVTAVTGGTLTAETPLFTFRGRNSGFTCATVDLGKICPGYRFFSCANSRAHAPRPEHFSTYGTLVDGGGSGDFILYDVGGYEWKPADAEFSNDANFVGDTLIVNCADSKVIGGNPGWARRCIYLGTQAVNTVLQNVHPFNGNPNGAAGEDGETAEPIALLHMGQSNALGQAGATTGDHTISSGVYFWNGDDDTTGTAYFTPAFGTYPLDRGSDPWANNMVIHMANRLKAQTGRDVYIIQIAKGARAIENWLKPATLTANGWTAGPDDFTDFMYPQIADAIAAIPGRVNQYADVFSWQQGEANGTAGDTAAQYAAKVVALVDDLTDEGVFEPDATFMSAGGTVPDLAWYATHRTAINLAAESVPTLSYVSSAGLTDLGDDVHFTGASLVTLGTRHAQAVEGDLDVYPSSTPGAGTDPRQDAIVFWSDAKGKVYANNCYFDEGYVIDNTAKLQIQGGRHLVIAARVALTHPYIRIKTRATEANDRGTIQGIDSTVGYFTDDWETLDGNYSWLHANATELRGPGKLTDVVKMQTTIYNDDDNGSPDRLDIKRGGGTTTLWERKVFAGGSAPTIPLDLYYSAEGMRMVRTGEDQGLFFGGAGKVGIGAEQAINGVLVLYSGGEARWESSVLGNFRPRSDNVYSIGNASQRASVIYAGTGTINTSDENEKQDIAELEAAELAVAQALPALVRKFRYRDSVAEKGAEARLHVGIIAQEVAQLFVDNGLDPANYGLWCQDDWVDSEGETHIRQGIRYDELCAFMIAGMAG